jgi:trimethylamine:corrinoid methyltransferase-like protein
MTGRDNARRRGRGGHVRNGRGGGGLPKPLPPLVNPLPPLELVNQDQLMRIVDAAFRVLEDAGLEILSDRCLDIYAA